ncbi:MAG: hypothetical protein QNJ18_11890 [Xenococcaceae cyanobacterium MO_167.B52]|nr:hypothetical protein [Xenococcaceae cyanobacterium MO_167.B52]
MGGSINREPIGTEELRRAMACKWVEDKEFYYDIISKQATQIQ